MLGICLGMQLLFAASEEGVDGDDTECLGIISERVSRLAGRPDLPVPHMGWNQLRVTAPSPLFDGVATRRVRLLRAQLRRAGRPVDARDHGLRR